MFSGTRGHVRVMTLRQLCEVIVFCGFTIEKTTSFVLGHYVLVKATKLA